MSMDDSRGCIDDPEENDEIPDALLREPQILELSDRDMDALLDAIANPPPPNAAMLRSVARWREFIAPE